MCVSNFMVFNKLKNIIKESLPLDKDNKNLLIKLKPFLIKTDFDKISKFFKQDKLGIYFLDKSNSFYELKIPQVRVLEKGMKFSDFNLDEELNVEIKSEFYKYHFKEFHKNYILTDKFDYHEFVSPNIKGMDTVKDAVFLQLFAKDAFHILLLGDPGTGKTDLLKSSEKLHDKSSFGLGSGVSGAGLSVTMSGDDVKLGLLPQADKGICCIDELNLIKSDDMGALYNAMEKGFVTYDKGGKHLKFDANVRILATANPKYDKFRGDSLSQIQAQMPFESALISRFHLIFIIKKPNLVAFKEISKEIISDKKKLEKSNSDYDFLKKYVSYTETLDVKIPVKIQSLIEKYIESVKIKESNLIFDVSPRFVVGFLRLVKARARYQMKKEVTKADFDYVKNIFEFSFKLNSYESDLANSFDVTDSELELLSDKANAPEDSILGIKSIEEKKTKKNKKSVANKIGASKKQTQQTDDSQDHSDEFII